MGYLPHPQENTGGPSVCLERGIRGEGFRRVWRRDVSPAQKRVAVETGSFNPIRVREPFLFQLA